MLLLREILPREIMPRAGRSWPSVKRGPSDGSWGKEMNDATSKINSTGVRVKRHFLQSPGSRVGPPRLDSSGSCQIEPRSHEQRANQGRHLCMMHVAVRTLAAGRGTPGALAGQGRQSILPSWAVQFRRRRTRVSPRLPLPFFPPSHFPSPSPDRSSTAARPLPPLDPARGRHSIALLSLYRLRDVEPSRDRPCASPSLALFAHSVLHGACVPDTFRHEPRPRWPPPWRALFVPSPAPTLAFCCRSRPCRRLLTHGAGPRRPRS